MAAEYRSIEYQLHESLVQLQDILSILGFEQPLLDRVADCKELIKSKQYNVAVMGEFKRGKSSLINALLGAKILPADATPTTATVNRITYGADPKAVITFHNGETKEILIEELSNYVTKMTSEGEARALQIKEATVYFPTVICQNHVDIIDTPGLNDEARMTQITIDMIANVDAVVVPIHARAPFSETEKKFVCQLIESGGIQNLIFVVTFLDQLDEEDYEYDRFMNYLRRRIQSEVFTELSKRENPEGVVCKAHQLLDHLQISGISSSLALESFVSNNRAMREKSRFEAFSSNLLRVVTAKQLENAVKKTVESIRYILAQFEEQDQNRRNALEEEARSLQAGEEGVRLYCAESSKTMDTLFADSYSVLQNSVNGFNQNKNMIVSTFVKKLSFVRKNKHEAVLTALNGAAEEVSGKLSQQNHALQDKIYHIFEASLLQMETKAPADLASVIACLGMTEEIVLEKTKESMLRFARTILENAVFSWKIPYVPCVSDLTSCNVIETVIQSADLSVSGYLSEIQQIIATIRKNWFSQYSAQIATLSAKAAEYIEHQKEAHDLQYKAYLRNYQTLYCNSREILDRCEHLWEEFKKGESL